MSDLNIRELKGIAERATPGPWTGKIVPVSYPECDDQDLPFVVTRPDGREIVTIPERYWRDDRYDYEHDGQFIATFDPPTVLALLSSAEAREEAERKAKRYFDEFWDVENERRAVCMAVEHHSNSGTPVSYVVRERLAEAETALQAAETRAQQAEARVERAIQAADAILARVTMVAGRYLYDAPSADLVPVLAEEKVELTAQMFRDLYNATSRDGSEIR